MANTQQGIGRFCDELIARVERAGATAVKLLRADSGFWNTKVFERLEQAGWQYSIGVAGGGRAPRQGEGGRRRRRWRPRGRFAGTLSDQAPAVRVADDGKTIVEGTR